jgi:hypothetical protein
MSVSEFPRPHLTDSGTPEVPQMTDGRQCDECGEPVEALQRYCVNCGAHRRGVADPAARYLSQASARARMHARAVAARSSARSARRRTLGRGTAILIALIPIAGGAGVLIGNSTAGTSAPVHHAGAASTATAAPKSKTAAAATGESYVQQQKSLGSTTVVP